MNLSKIPRVISRMTDIIMIRTFGHEKIETFAKHSDVPVINALTDSFIPVSYADVQTYVEHRGSIQGKTVAWIGDGNNMCHSWINAAMQFDFKLQIACPVVMNRMLLLSQMPAIASYYPMIPHKLLAVLIW